MKDHAVNRLSRENSEIGAQEPRSAQLLALQPRTMAQAFAIAAVMALTLTPSQGRKRERERTRRHKLHNRRTQPSRLTRRRPPPRMNRR